jgi:hypothetical protein
MGLFIRKGAEVVAAAVGGASVFLLLLLTDYVPLKRIALWPGFTFGPAVSRLLPDRLIYMLAPDGGASAMIMLVLVVSFSSWAFVGAAVWCGIRCARAGKRPSLKTMGPR